MTSMPYRCIGSVHREAGDCLTPAVGAVVCWGYLDRDLGVPLEESVDEPAPMVFPVCKLHRAPMVEWAEHMWGSIANGLWVEAAAIPQVIAELEAERVSIYPDTARAVRVAV